MSRILTISVSDETYDDLHGRLAPDEIGRLVETYLRERLAAEIALEDDYRAMAADVEREREAMEWIEAESGEALE